LLDHKSFEEATGYVAEWQVIPANPTASFVSGDRACTAISGS